MGAPKKRAKHRKTSNELRGFLLDELLPHNISLSVPNLRVRHIVKDLNKGGIKDPEVKRLAEKERLVLVTGDEGFRKREISKTWAIIHLVGAGKLTPEEIKRRLSRIIKLFRFPADFLGKRFIVTQRDVEIVDNSGKSEKRPFR